MTFLEAIAELEKLPYIYMSDTNYNKACRKKRKFVNIFLDEHGRLLYYNSVYSTPENASTSDFAQFRLEDLKADDWEITL